MRVRLGFLSPCSKWPLYARWSMASLADLRLMTYPYPVTLPPTEKPAVVR
jgi:hypothetical protein